MMYIIKVLKKPRFFMAGLLIILTLSIFLILCSTKDNLAAVTTVDIDWYPILSRIFEQRNGFVLKQNSTGLGSIYLTNERNGLWAYQNELKRSEYLKNWSIKQGVEFISIKSKINIRRSRQVGRGYSFYVVCADEYKYVYKNDPKINAFYLGTYHSLDLIPLDNAWIISREWYDDPLSSTLDAKSIPEGMTLAISAHDQKAVPDLNQSRAAAVDYANSYCGAASPTNSNKYNSKYTDYNPLGGDCANFVSQVLYEGGGFKKNSTWNYKDGKGSRTWIKARELTDFLIYSGRASLISKGKYKDIYQHAYDLLPGDIISYSKKGKITHVSVVTGFDSKGYPLVNCHNTDRYRVPFDIGWNQDTVCHLLSVHY